MISENDLKKASTHVHEILLRLLPDLNDYAHDFSKDFEEKITYIINTQKTSPHKDDDEP